MTGSKAKKKILPIAAPIGLPLEKPKDFYKNVSSAIKTALDLPFATHQGIQRGTREVIYIKEPNSVSVPGEGGLLPALQLYSNEKQSAWLVIEIECEGSNPTMLHQVSLKLLQGVTTETAKLCFRAEWDVRNDVSDHAQPHWNIHPPGSPPREDSQNESFETFAKRETEGASDTFAAFLQTMTTNNHTLLDGGSQDVDKKNNDDYGFSLAQMHRFHFAMAVNWHAKPSTHTPKLTNSEELIRWIVACVQYIKQQFTFMMSLQ